MPNLQYLFVQHVLYNTKSIELYLLFCTAADWKVAGLNPNMSEDINVLSGSAPEQGTTFTVHLQICQTNRLAMVPYQ